MVAITLPNSTFSCLLPRIPLLPTLLQTFPGHSRCHLGRARSYFGLTGLSDYKAPDPLSTAMCECSILSHPSRPGPDNNMQVTTALVAKASRSTILSRMQRCVLISLCQAGVSGWTQSPPPNLLCPCLFLLLASLSVFQKSPELQVQVWHVVLAHACIHACLSVMYTHNGSP